MDFKLNPLSCHGRKGHHLASHCFCTIILLMIPEQAKHVATAALLPLSGLLLPHLCKWGSVQKSPSQRGLPQWPNQMFILLLNSLFYCFLADYHQGSLSYFKCYPLSQTDKLVLMGRHVFLHWALSLLHLLFLLGISEPYSFIPLFSLLLFSYKVWIWSNLAPFLCQSSLYC